MTLNTQNCSCQHNLWHLITSVLKGRCVLHPGRSGGTLNPTFIHLFKTYSGEYLLKIVFTWQLSGTWGGHSHWPRGSTSAPHSLSVSVTHEQDAAATRGVWPARNNKIQQTSMRRFHFKGQIHLKLPEHFTDAKMIGKKVHSFAPDDLVPLLSPPVCCSGSWNIKRHRWHPLHEPHILPLQPLYCYLVCTVKGACEVVRHESGTETHWVSSNCCLCSFFSCPRTAARHPAPATLSTNLSCQLRRLLGLRERNPILATAQNCQSITCELLILYGLHYENSALLSWQV